MLLTSMLGHRQEIFESKGKKLSSSTKSPADWMPADKISTALSRIKQKTWTRQPVSMITDHSAHSTPLPVGFRTWLWRYRCFLLLMSMLWHRQAIYSNRKKTSCLPLLNAVFEPRVSDTKSPADWMPADKKERLRYPGSIKKLNSTARLYDQRAFNPHDPNASWLPHLALAIYTFLVINCNALARASSIRIERRQVVSLYWMQDSNAVSQTPNHQQTEWLLTNRFSYRGSSKKTELDSPYLWSASIQPTRPHCQLTFAPGCGDNQVCFC